MPAPQEAEPVLNQGEIEGDKNAEKSFDNDFDAGVEADEENDPKRYIQQLTGKLSQKLRDYNETLGTPDVDLNKYVAGMVVKQAVNGLDDTERGEIIKKINTDESDDNNKPSDEAQPTNDEETIDAQEMPMENKTYKFTKKQLTNLKEIFGGNNEIITTKDNDKVEQDIPKDVKKKDANNPFIAPTFK